MLSTASPVKDKNKNTVSLRKQGAGMVQLQNATNTGAYLTDKNGNQPLISRNFFRRLANAYRARKGFAAKSRHFAFKRTDELFGHRSAHMAAGFFARLFRRIFACKPQRRQIGRASCRERV